MNSKIATALVAAQKSLKGVHKASTNAHHRYDYASAESIYAECRTALYEHGLSVVPSSAVIDEGGAVLRRAYVVLHESGEEMHAAQDWPIVPGAGRPQDKAAASAYTASLAYFLRDLLLLPRVEKGVDLDADERDAPPAKAKASRADIAEIGSIFKQRGYTPKAAREILADLTGRPATSSDLTADEAKMVIRELTSDDEKGAA